MSDKTAIRRMPIWDRSSYKPSGDVNFVEVPNLPPGMTAWTWEDWSSRLNKKLPMGIVFIGKAQKPTWFHSFQSEAQRQRKIEETAASYKMSLDAKLKRQEERKQFQHGLAVNDILVSSWGYEQTNVNFYQVVAVYGKAVGIREISSERVSSDGHGSDYVIPVPNSFEGPVLKKIPGGSGYGKTFVKINSFAHAYKWDGKPERETSSGWGH